MRLLPRILRREYRAIDTGGFNLIELLIAMAILSFIVAMSASIFSRSRQTMDSGTSQENIDQAGRTALGLIGADLRSTIADELLSFQAGYDRFDSSSYGFTNSEICFIALDGEPTATNRALTAIMYWVQEMASSPGRYELVRGAYPVDTGSRNCYAVTNWYADRPSPNECGIVAGNVSGFCLVTDEGPEFTAIGGINLPHHIDVYLEVLSDADAKRAASLQITEDRSNFVEKNARRFTTRVHFQNANGYRLR